MYVSCLILFHGKEIEKKKKLEAYRSSSRSPNVYLVVSGNENRQNEIKEIIQLIIE